MTLVSTSLLYGALMSLTLVITVVWHMTHPLRCHMCHTTARVARDLGPVPLCLDCFLEQSAPSPATLEAYDPEAKIPTEVITPRKGSQS